jgi:hypothetical protein
MGAYLPAPPPSAEPPVLWGSEAHVTELFAGTGIELTFERELLEPAIYESAEAAIEFHTTKFGPLIMARRLAEESGRWPELRAELEAFHDRAESAEYLVVVGRKGLG